MKIMKIELEFKRCSQEGCQNLMILGPDDPHAGMLPIREFNRSRRIACGYASRCRECDAKVRKVRRDARVDSGANNEYYKANKAKIRERVRARNAARREAENAAPIHRDVEDTVLMPIYILKDKRLSKGDILILAVLQNTFHPAAGGESSAAIVSAATGLSRVHTTASLKKLVELEFLYKEDNGPQPAYIIKWIIDREIIEIPLVEWEGELPDGLVKAFPNGQDLIPHETIAARAAAWNRKLISKIESERKAKND